MRRSKRYRGAVVSEWDKGLFPWLPAADPLCLPDTRVIPTASNPSARASCLMAAVIDIGIQRAQCWAEQSKRTLKWAEHRTDLHRPHVPTMFVFQSVSALLNRHCRRPPLETVAQGCLVPGMEATRHPWGNGTRQRRPISPCSIEKLHDNSVVAPESSGSCAFMSMEGRRSIQSSNTNRLNAMRPIVIGINGNTVLYLAAMERAA